MRPEAESYYLVSGLLKEKSSYDFQILRLNLQGKQKENTVPINEHYVEC